ncbi:hypothetical protein MRS44_017464 [Fusarium solani]|uniref:uncharacterized protein n=1 Tax=Fusarium solani TaxID=169388 RepID=UPI0032C40151|nr:hypothetical protein MRS44_017464 [Fusarium solani]
MPSLSSYLSLFAIGNASAAASRKLLVKSRLTAGGHTLNDNEKTTYLDAELCLMSKPAKLGVEGAVNPWDELDWAHIAQANVIHNVGAFLPWHRYYMRVHGYLLQSECGYKGGQPYWDEVRDLEALNESVVFDPDTGFGGQGDNCVNDGPFANLTLHLNATSKNVNECLTREFSPDGFQNGQQVYIDECLNTTNYVDASNATSSDPISPGTLLWGAYPGDPLFFLHHTYHDRLWWQWQQDDLENRLTDIGGRNVPYDSFLESNGIEYPSDALLLYDGDDGNVTTLNHNLWMAGIAVSSWLP